MGLLLLAVAPSMVILCYIYFKDKIEKEPVNFVFKNFILGATLSIIITAILGSVLQRFFPVTDPENIAQQFVKAFIVVALVEEFAKYVVVRFVAQPNKEFSEPYDGIMYAVAVSLGFATVENVLYTFQYGVETGILRAFTAVPAHAMFGVLMGFFMGKAKYRKATIKNNLLGLLLAVTFHGLYDFFLFIDFIPGISTGAFVSLLLGIILARKAIKIHQKIT